MPSGRPCRGSGEAGGQGPRVPEPIRSDKDPVLTYRGIRQRLGARRLSVGLVSPWGNGHVESFNGRLQDELPNREIFCTLQEAQVLIERWRVQYNRRRQHSSLEYRPPAPEACVVPNWGSPIAAAAAFNPAWSLVQKPGAGHPRIAHGRKPITIRRLPAFPALIEGDGGNRTLDPYLGGP